MKSKSSFITAVFVILLLAGCAAQSEYYSKVGATEQDFMKDRLTCLKQVTPTISDVQMKASASPFGPSSRAIPNCGMLETCLAAHGYVMDPNGALEVPPSMHVSCRK